MKIELESSLKQNISFQILFWMALLLFSSVRSYGEYSRDGFEQMVIYNVCHWVFQIIGANFIYYVLIRKYFDQKKYILFSGYLVISIYVISVVNRIFIVYMAEPFFIETPKDSLISIFTDINYLLFHYAFPVISGAFIFISVMFILRYKDEKQNATILLQEKAELELKSLKSQLNPHFLFNTLNNIYSLSLINSEKTSESISRLSDILDYILYKGQRNQIPVSEELTIINDYIALESLRYNDRLKIHQFIKIDSPNTVPPLLYLTLVENAFKHGAGKIAEEVEIHIHLETNTNNSIFRIENTCVSDTCIKEEGIGLQNIEKQLQHQYRDHFKLNISHENNTFKVEINTPAKI